MLFHWIALTDKNLRCPNRVRKLTAACGGSYPLEVVCLLLSHLDRTSCSGWSPGCSRCGSDRCRSHSCLYSGPSLHMGHCHTHPHLQWETETESRRDQMQHYIVALFHQQRLFTFQALTLELLYCTVIPQWWAWAPLRQSRGSSQGLHHEVRDHSTVAALWMACALLSGVTEQVNINKQIPLILACFISQGFCVMFGAEDLIAQKRWQTELLEPLV